MVELNKPYKAEDLARELFNVSYGTFRNNKDKYLTELSEYYEWEYVKRKYILVAQKKEYHVMSKSEKQYENIYLPAVLNYVGNEIWSTGTGIAIAILNEEQVKELHHAIRTARGYVCQVLNNEYDIRGKKYAACYGSGNYPRLMTDEELEKWAELKSMYSKGTGQKIMELTEEYAHGTISNSDYVREVKTYASSAYATALFNWMQEYGFIPVLINHYERKGIGLNEDFE